MVRIPCSQTTEARLYRAITKGQSPDAPAQDDLQLVDDNSDLPALDMGRPSSTDVSVSNPRKDSAASTQAVEVLRPPDRPPTSGAVVPASSGRTHSRNPTEQRADPLPSKYVKNMVQIFNQIYAEKSV